MLSLQTGFMSFSEPGIAEGVHAEVRLLAFTIGGVGSGQLSKGHSCHPQQTLIPTVFLDQMTLQLNSLQNPSLIPWNPGWFIGIHQLTKVLNTAHLKT